MPLVCPKNVISFVLFFFSGVADCVDKEVTITGRGETETHNRGTTTADDQGGDLACGPPLAIQHWHDLARFRLLYGDVRWGGVERTKVLTLPYSTNTTASSRQSSVGL